LLFINKLIKLLYKLSLYIFFIKVWSATFLIALEFVIALPYSTLILAVAVPPGKPVDNAVCELMYDIVKTEFVFEENFKDLYDLQSKLSAWV